MSDSVIEARQIVKLFAPKLTAGDRLAAKLGAHVETRSVHAVDGIDLSIKQGKTLGLVGESGCGKSTLGRIIAGIMPPTAGDVRIDGKAVMTDGRKATTNVQMIFQDPFASLDPRMRIGDIISEGPIAHGLVDKKNARDYVAGHLRRAGLDPELANRFPHQFSGGQRQRVAIARALAMQPEVLICDEPVASLDVSIQAQIINLFLKLKRELAITVLFISHDLSLVRHVSEHVAIMYLGRIVESGPTETVYANPKHPYTQGLLASIPKLKIEEGAKADLKPIKGEIPSPLDPPPGCRFNPRCPIAIDRCRVDDPELQRLASGQDVACHLAE